MKSLIKNVKVTNMSKNEMVLFGIVFVATMLIMVSIADAGETQYDRIKDKCRYEWMSDYQMQEYCYKNQTTAMHKFVNQYRKYVEDFDPSKYKNAGEVPAEIRIIAGCFNNWRNEQFDTCDWQMVIYCIDNQFESYNRMKD